METKVINNDWYITTLWYVSFMALITGHYIGPVEIIPLPYTMLLLAIGNTALVLIGAFTRQWILALTSILIVIPDLITFYNFIV